MKQNKTKKKNHEQNQPVKYTVNFDLSVVITLKQIESLWKK